MIVELPGVGQDKYEQVLKELGFDRKDFRPKGFISHAAGEGPNGWTVVDVWKSEADFDAFGRSQLGPAMQRVGRRPHPKITAVPVHFVHPRAARASGPLRRKGIPRSRLANRLVSENKLIVVGDLKIQSLLEKSSKGLAKLMLDAAWGLFLSKLAGKAEEAGRRFMKVPPRGTSSTCSACGAIRPKELSERIHECPCGLRLDRDRNASLNMLRLGRSLQASA